MKKIFQYLLLPVVAILMVTSCETDIDSNPTLDLSHVGDGFVLNVPAMATNNTYDLTAAEKLFLTCSQPNYGGIPYSVRYYVQVALDADFAKFTELSTSYTSARMGVDTYEINQTLVALFQAAHPDTDVPTDPVPAYFRLRAILDGYEQYGENLSNIITLPNVLMTYQAPKAELPKQLYVVGGNIGKAWSTWKPLASVFGIEGEFYTMVYIESNGMFKWGTEIDDWRGGDRLRAINDKANAGATINESDNNNIQFANGGWYVLDFVSEIVGNSVQFELNIYPGKAYVIGNAFGSWTATDSALEMTAPADASGVWVSPAATASGELRAYIVVGSYSWWQTEFTLYKGTTLYFRDFDIPDNWANSAKEKGKKDDPDNYSVTMQPGQMLYVDFNLNTGEVK